MAFQTEKQVLSLPFWLNTGIAKVTLKVELVFQWQMQNGNAYTLDRILRKQLLRGQRQDETRWKMV